MARSGSQERKPGAEARSGSQERKPGANERREQPSPGPAQGGGRCSDRQSPAGPAGSRRSGPRPAARALGAPQGRSAAVGPGTPPGGFPAHARGSASCRRPGLKPVPITDHRRVPRRARSPSSSRSSGSPLLPHKTRVLCSTRKGPHLHVRPAGCSRAVLPSYGCSDRLEAELRRDGALRLIARRERAVLSWLQQRRDGDARHREMPGVHCAQGVLAHKRERLLFNLFLGRAQNGHRPGEVCIEQRQQAGLIAAARACRAHKRS
jgi:hypothetical protein